MSRMIAPALLARVHARIADFRRHAYAEDFTDEDVQIEVMVFAESSRRYPLGVSLYAITSICAFEEPLLEGELATAFVPIDAADAAAPADARIH